MKPARPMLALLLLLAGTFLRFAAAFALAPGEWTIPILIGVLVAAIASAMIGGSWYFRFIGLTVALVSVIDLGVEAISRTTSSRFEQRRKTELRQAANTQATEIRNLERELQGNLVTAASQLSALPNSSRAGF